MVLWHQREIEISHPISVWKEDISTVAETVAWAQFMSFLSESPRIEMDKSELRVNVALRRSIHNSRRIWVKKKMVWIGWQQLSSLERFHASRNLAY